MSIIKEDLFDLLRAEHKEVQTLLEECKESNGSKRKKLLEKIEANLIPHARAEEKTLYSMLYGCMEKDSTSEATQINEAYAEHAAVDKLLGELKKLDVNDETWLGKFMVIKENIEHHVEEEQDELFELAKKTFNDKELDELLQSYRQVKEQFKQSLPTQGQISERQPDTSLREASGS